MHLVVHACFTTTHTFYLAVREDMFERDRAASAKAMAAISVTNLLQGPSVCTTWKNAPPKRLLKKGLQLGPVGFEPTTNGL